MESLAGKLLTASMHFSLQGQFQARCNLGYPELTNRLRTELESVFSQLSIFFHIFLMYIMYRNHVFFHLTREILHLTYFTS